MGYEWSLKMIYKAQPRDILPIGVKPREVLLVKILFRRTPVWWKPWTWFASWRSVGGEFPAPTPSCRQVVVGGGPTIASTVGMMHELSSGWRPAPFAALLGWVNVAIVLFYSLWWWHGVEPVWRMVPWLCAFAAGWSLALSLRSRSIPPCIESSSTPAARER